MRREASFTAETMARLFAADRGEHLSGPGGIRAALERGELAVSDRYFFSSLAYQSVECDPDLVRELNRRFPLPEYLIFLDVPPEIGEGRVSRRGEREIYERTGFPVQGRRQLPAALGGLRGLGNEDPAGRRHGGPRGHSPPAMELCGEKPIMKG